MPRPLGLFLAYLSQLLQKQRDTIDFSGVSSHFWRVIPVETAEEILWIDSAGFPLATSPKAKIWQSDFFERYDFNLDVSRQVVTAEAYL